MTPPETRARALLDHPAVVARVARCGLFDPTRTPATLAMRNEFSEALSGVRRVAERCPSLSPANRPDPSAQDPREAEILRMLEIAKIDHADLEQRAEILAAAEDAAHQDALAWIRVTAEQVPAPRPRRRPAPPDRAPARSPAPWSCVPRDTAPRDPDPPIDPAWEWARLARLALEQEPRLA